MEKLNEAEDIVEKRKISVIRILGYFIIYSVLGYILETTYALVVYSKFESRKSFLFGPFCSIYGVGAVVMILALQKCKNKKAIFIGGALTGAVVEYVISYVGEVLLNVRWWDYSNNFLNINGRICLLYTILWGVISLAFMTFINPKVDKFIDFLKSKIDIRFLKICTIIIIITIVIDTLVSGFAIEAFLAKTVVEKDIDVENRARYEESYEKIYGNEWLAALADGIATPEFIIKVYPNLKLTLSNGNTALIQDYYSEVKPYYYKFEF